MNHFRAVSISYKIAPLAVREQVSLTEELIAVLLNNCKDYFGLQDVLVLSTCNRTEIHYRSEKDLDTQLIFSLCSLKGIKATNFDAYFIRLKGIEALKHLFAVSIGLESMVLGDIQIINQVKKAYQLSADLGMCTFYFHRLLHTVFYTNKRVANETDFKDGLASLASVSIELAKKFIRNKLNPKITVVGLGEIGANVACNLKKVEGEIYLYNRTKEKTNKIAQEHQFIAGEMELLHKQLPEMDVIISSIQSDQLLFKKEHFSARKTPLLIIDLGVPRNVEQEVDLIENVNLINIDHLNEKVQTALAKRQAEVPLVNVLINETIDEFVNWKKETEFLPVIQQFKNALETIKKQELARNLSKLDKQQSVILESIADGMIQKIVKMPIVELKAACKRGESDTLVEVLQDLFNLEKVPVA